LHGQNTWLQGTGYYEVFYNRAIIEVSRTTVPSRATLIFESRKTLNARRAELLSELVSRYDEDQITRDGCLAQQIHLAAGCLNAARQEADHSFVVRLLDSEAEITTGVSYNKPIPRTRTAVPSRATSCAARRSSLVFGFSPQRDKGAE
jgi:hypothetical protein